MRPSTFGRSIVGRAMEILLLEDDLTDAKAVMEVLDQGHVRCRLSLVRDGLEAMAFIRRKGIFAKAPRPDLIMLDMDVPKMSGREVLAEIQSDVALMTIPVVVLSAAEHYRALLQSGCYATLDFMPKPLDAERFVAMVKSLHYSLLTDLVAGSMVQVPA
jgi:two-component system, chemotaxis family, response regulator Rcp1